MNNSKPISHWPEEDRPREKMLSRGASALSDTELLAVFITNGTPSLTAIDVARILLERFGGLRGVLQQPRKKVCEVPGMGSGKFALLQAAVELGKRSAGEKLYRSGPLTSPTQAADFLLRKLRDRRNEVFAVLYLDTRHQVIAYEELFYGSINSAFVHPREVVQNTLAQNAAAIIVAHNHPSGIAEPSPSDCNLTSRLKNALALIDVKLLDHLIIGDGEYVSMSERGMM